MSCFILMNKSNNKYLLDQINGAISGMSLRRLTRKYNNACIRVRRSSDNTEKDIGFSGDYLDISSLHTFVGTGNGYITKWYDQSGNGQYAAESVAGNQPKIVALGVLNSVNSKPAIYFDGSTQKLSIAHSNAINLQNFSLHLICKPTRSAYGAVEVLIQKQQYIGTATGYFIALRTDDPAVRLSYYSGNSTLTSVSDPRDGKNHNFIAIKNSGNLIIHKDGIKKVNETFTDTTITNTTPLTIACNYGGGTPGNFYQGYMQELIILPSNIDTKAQLLYSNSKYWGI